MSPLLLFIWGVALLFVPGYLIAFCFAKPRETRGADEFYYFVICALGVSTGSGAFEIVAFLARRTRHSHQAATAVADCPFLLHRVALYVAADADGQPFSHSPPSLFPATSFASQTGFGVRATAMPFFSWPAISFSVSLSTPADGLSLL